LNNYKINALQFWHQNKHSFTSGYVHMCSDLSHSFTVDCFTTVHIQNYHLELGTCAAADSKTTTSLTN